MPLADDAPRSAAPVPPRSPRLVRGVLAATALTGLTGLALTGSAPTVSTLSVAPASATTLALVAEPTVPHGPVLAPAPRPVRTVASRSRAAAPKVTTKKAKAATATWFRPCAAGIGSPFGMRWGRPHKGVDFNGSTGDPIRAIGAGTVVGSGYLSGESGYGLITIIRHPNGFYSAYAHQSKSLVSAGEHVDAGEVIGRIGSTGHSTGSHLHFEIRTAPHGGQINPVPWLREHGVRV